MEKNYSFFEILKKVRKFKFGIILALIISIFILYNIISVKTSKQPIEVQPNIEQVLLIVADSINKSCPRTINRITDLKNVTLPRSKTFQYNFSLQLDSKQYDLDKLAKIIDKEIISEFKSTPQFEMFKENKVTVIYHFIDKNGRLMFKSVFYEM